MYIIIYNRIWYLYYYILFAKRNCERLSSVHANSSVRRTHIRNLGVILDSELPMVDHISQLCRSCFFSAASFARDSLLSRRNRFSCSCTASSATGSTTVTASSTVPAGSNSTVDLQSILNACSGMNHREDTEVLPYLGQHSRRASLASNSLPAQIQDLPLRSELTGRYCPGLPPGTLRRRFLKCRPSEPSIGESRGPSCPKNEYDSIWAARLFCVWAGHLEFSTAGGSKKHEHVELCSRKVWTHVELFEKFENILHAKATLTPLRIQERISLINQLFRDGFNCIVIKSCPLSLMDLILKLSKQVHSVHT